MRQDSMFDMDTWLTSFDGIDETAISDDNCYTIEIDFREAAIGGTKHLRLTDGQLLALAIPEGVEDGQQLQVASLQGEISIEVHIQWRNFASQCVVFRHC